MNQGEILLLRIQEKYSISNIEEFFEYVDQLKYSKEIELGFIKIANLLPDSVIIADEAGIIQYANDSALREFGYSTLYNEHIEILMPDRYKDIHTKNFAESPSVIYNNKINYFYAIDSNGEEFPISISSIKYRKNGQYNYIAIIRNLKPEYLKIDIIKEVFENLPIMMMIINNDQVEFANNEFIQNTSCNLEDIKVAQSVMGFSGTIMWSDLNIDLGNECSSIVNSSWRVMELANKQVCIGPSRSEFLLRDAIEAVIEAKTWINN